MMSNRSKLATVSTLSFLLSNVFASGDFCWSDRPEDLRTGARVVEEKISQLRTTHLQQASAFLAQLAHVKESKTFEEAKSNILHATDKMSKDDGGKIRQLTVNIPERKELRNVCKGHDGSRSFTTHSSACEWVRGWRTHLNHDPTIDPGTIRADDPKYFSPSAEAMQVPVIGHIWSLLYAPFSPIVNAVHSYEPSYSYKHKPLPPHQSTCNKYRQEWTTVAQARTETISLIHIHNAFMELHNLMVRAENRRRTEEQDRQQTLQAAIQRNQAAARAQAEREAERQATTRSWAERKAERKQKMNNDQDLKDLEKAWSRPLSASYADFCRIKSEQEAARLEQQNKIWHADKKRESEREQQKQALALRNKELENDRLIAQRKLEHQRGLEFQARVRQEAESQRQEVIKKANAKKEAEHQRAEATRISAARQAEAHARAEREALLQQESARRNDIIRENTVSTVRLEQDRLEHLRLSRESQNRREFRETRERERSQRDNSQQFGQTTTPSLRPSYYVQVARR